ncbi:hypothetical protein [Streptomyces sp. NRRL S-920]|uniref:hypothetical protein n=1 Tax=Streptomyces sp. NRRL S-920 TaxID=1463921 RepID=UPI00056C43F0|nr:hypothetical protein [Streptomyces sp. NRRL S-920]
MTPTDMGPTHAPSGRRRRTLVTVPASAESVPPRPQQADPREQPYPQPHRQPYQQPRRPSAYQPPQQQAYQQPQQAYPPPQPTYQQPQQAYQPQQPPPPDPPIYLALIRYWADRGRTLPGRHDPEWVRLMAPPVPRGPFSASRDPRGDGR